MALSSLFDLALYALGMQFLLAVICFLDTIRHNRESTIGYLLAMISLPGVGIIVCLYYLAHREEFPQQDVWTPELSDVTPGTGCVVETTGNEVLWNCQARGLTTLRHRLTYIAVSSKNRFKIATGVGYALIMVLGLRGESDFGDIVVFSAVFFVASCIYYVLGVREFTNTTVGLDTVTGTLGVKYHSIDHPLVPRYGFIAGDPVDIGPDLIENLELVRVGQECLARIGYDHANRRNKRPKSFLVPAGEVGRLRDTLTNHGVSVQDRTADGTNDRIVRQRIYGTAAWFGIVGSPVILWLVFPG